MRANELRERIAPQWFCVGVPTAETIIEFAEHGEHKTRAAVTWSRLVGRSAGLGNPATIQAPSAYTACCPQILQPMRTEFCPSEGASASAPELTRFAPRVRSCTQVRASERVASPTSAGPDRLETVHGNS